MSNNANRKQECQEWYKNHKDLYSACANTIERLINTLLKEEEIPYHSIQSRIKTEESFINKCLNEKYQNPISEITDVCGLRIITYTKKNVEEIRRIIEDTFQIDTVNSIDKAEQMSDDQVGYLSIHYIASLKRDRTKLPEYHSYENIMFEIQIRTLLQHAWAEIEHDRNYKFSGELPRKIKRRFYLVAGTLELLDREFEQISEDIDQYAKEVRLLAEKGNLDVLIDSTSLLEYLSIRLKDYIDDGTLLNNYDKEIIAELQDFGINTLKDLDEIITDEFIRALPSGDNYIGILRNIMMAENPKKYFDEAWKESWWGLEEETYEFIKSFNPDIEEYANKVIIY